MEYYLIFTILASIFLSLAVLLLLHHKWKHCRHNDIESDEKYSKNCREWFQVEDVCVSHCTHEDWILLCLCLMVSYGILAIIYW